jgi:sortase A
MHKYTYGKNNTAVKKKAKKISGVTLIIFGIGTLFYFFFPLFSFHLYLSSSFADGNIEAPLPKRFVVEGNSSIGNLLTSGITNVTTNYKDARNWFPDFQKGVGVDNEVVKQFALSIPSQGIYRSTVSADDFDLSKHLVEYFTTSKNPVDKGTSVIFGHSTLPQWFDPKNYMTVFARMHLIKDGDEVIITVNGQDFHYKVFSISIMDSTNPNIFSQSFDNSYITLVTCTPPGTTWKRLVVRASLQSI